MAENSLLSQSGQLNTFDPTDNKTTRFGRKTMPSLSGSTLQTNTGNRSYDDMWEAGRESRIASQVDSVRDMDIDNMGLQGKTTADNYSYSEGRGGLTNTQSEILGAGVQAGTALASGIMQGVKGKRARESAVAEAERQLGERRAERDDQWELENEQIANQKEQARYEQAMQNNILRLSMFERDFAKEMQRYQDQQEAMSRFNQNATDNEAFKMAIAQRMGGM